MTSKWTRLFWTRDEETDLFILPPEPPSGALGEPERPSEPSVPGAEEAEERSGSPKRPLEEQALPEASRARVAEAVPELKRLAEEPLDPPGSGKLQRVSAIFDDLELHTNRVSAATTPNGLEVPVEVNVDRSEELQALRASQPMWWYDTDFDHDQEVAGVD